jgi:Tol biopolymer transport system component
MVFPACERENDPIIVVEETSIHERAAWSPDGLTIAFSSLAVGSQGIYLIDSTGLNLRLLKSGEGIGLSWSPDAQWIVFSANGSLHKIKATGDSLTQLTASSSDIRPSWSPDGFKIVYRSNGLKILNLSTGQTATILNAGNFPTWMSTGTILFITSAGAGLNRADYFFETIDSTGGQRQTLYSVRASADCAFSSVNPAGTHLLFSARPFDGSDRAQIVRITLSSSQGSQLTVDGGDYPAWSPDGANIVYTRTAKGDGGLWIMNADGSNKRRLTQP